MPKEFIHSLILIFAIALSFLFPKTVLAQYDLQISAVLFIILFLGKKLNITSPKTKLLESVIFTLIITFIVNTTGGYASPFFFLLYFLLFSLSLLLEPIISITTTISLIVLFIISMPQNQEIKAMLPIFSLAFLTPFALFMGQEFIDLQNLRNKDQKIQEDTFFFLSLMLKNHIKTIKDAAENFMGDHELSIIKKQAKNMEHLIEKFEKQEHEISRT